MLSLSLSLAQDFSGIKICVNPGHGGNDPANDRYIESTGFWESESNLTKGLHLRDLLQAHGATVVMTRTQNRDQDDLPLSQIVAIANDNNCDWMHSIHSNAHNANTNYTLMLYQGFTNNPTFPESKTLSLIMGSEIQKADRTSSWTYAGDFDFYGTGQAYLGVFKGLTMPGTLSEGSFHDYLIESARLMNLDYRRHEALAIFRSFVAYYNLQALATGVIAGIIRDQSQTVTNYNSSLPNDRYKPIIHSRILLKPLGREYIVDQKNNGFFIFNDLTPGVYKVIYDAYAFKTDSIEITVQANKSVFADRFLVSDPNKPPKVYAVTPANGDSLVVTTSAIDITFSRSMDKNSTAAAIRLYPKNESPDSLQTFSAVWSNYDKIASITPDDALRVNTEYVVEVGSSALSQGLIPIESPYSSSFSTALDHVYPEVTAHIPAQGADSVIYNAELKITFSHPMKTTDPAAFIDLNPLVSGTFSWIEDNHTLKFIPTSGWPLGQTCLVTVKAGLKDTYGIGFKADSVFSFHTRKLNSMVVTGFLPDTDLDQLSVKPKFSFYFSAPINTSSISGAVQFRDMQENYIPSQNVTFSEKNGKGIMEFESKNLLSGNTDYKIYLMPKIADIYGLSMADTFEYYFRTESDQYVSGSIVEDFESLTGWIDPTTNPQSIGLDTSQTFSELNSKYKINGSYSAGLNYVFNEDQAVCFFSAQDSIAIEISDSVKIGAWIYGDGKAQQIGWHFTGFSQPVHSDTLNWIGWKFIDLRLSATVFGSQAYFTGFSINRINQAAASGKIYFDDFQTDVVTTLPGDEPEMQINTYVLARNYPNPFNPVTTISYEIGQAGLCKIQVYNLLGQQVTELVNGFHKPGLYAVQWNAGSFPSGIYFYTMQINNYKATQKMILLK